ncbi:MAG: suppressor of fused domain protein [Verrucomicrobiota bacterium]|nr:suppressor of fused domain protein [Verrucomicrobiota bacterium]
MLTPVPLDHEHFLKYLLETFGTFHEVLQHNSPDGGRPVFVFIYQDVPEKGMITGITYGLSLTNHPEWTNGKPELVISVNSQNTSWPFAIAYFAAEFRGQKAFAPGDIFTMDGPIAPDSTMNGLLVYGTSILQPQDSVFQLANHKIHLLQMYPVYQSEITLYEKIGLQAFVSRPDFDFYNVTRTPLTDEEKSAPNPK